MRFEFIARHTHEFRVTIMCRVLQVSRAGYYAWCRRPESKRRKHDYSLAAKIRAVYSWSKRRYGSPRIAKELRVTARAEASRKRVARLMREEGLRAKGARKFRVTTNSQHSSPIADNVLDRNFRVDTIEQTNRVWASDITYIRTREGWLYLAIVLDLASRRVVGWSLRKRLDQELAISALKMALKHRRPRAGGLHHSDRGVQYASSAYQQLLSEVGFKPSMSRSGNCWDNAVAESFFATLKKELLSDGDFISREIASREIFEFIEIWYNRQRRHSSLGYQTPIEYEEEMLKKQTAA